MAPRIATEQIANALVTTRGMIYLAARQLGCDPKTIYNRLEQSPSLRALRDAQRELVLDQTELKLFEAVEAGKPWAIAFLLKTQGKHRGYAERHEHTGADGAPIEIIEVVIPEAG